MYNVKSADLSYTVGRIAKFLSGVQGKDLIMTFTQSTIYILVEAGDIYTVKLPCVSEETVERKIAVTFQDITMLTKLSDTITFSIKSSWLEAKALGCLVRLEYSYKEFMEKPTIINGEDSFLSSSDLTLFKSLSTLIYLEKVLKKTVIVVSTGTSVQVYTPSIWFKFNIRFPVTTMTLEQVKRVQFLGLNTLTHGNLIELHSEKESLTMMKSIVTIEDSFSTLEYTGEHVASITVNMKHMDSIKLLLKSTPTKLYLCGSSIKLESDRCHYSEVSEDAIAYVELPFDMIHFILTLLGGKFSVLKGGNFICLRNSAISIIMSL